jgi:hypothetical protein
LGCRAAELELGAVCTTSPPVAAALLVELKLRRVPDPKPK